jgi:Carboxypeptidase regulatory-like domain
MGGNFAIPNPCAKKWSDLQGEGRARFCATCKTHVHFITDYSPNEWKKLWGDSNGHVCGFLGDTLAPPRSRRVILVGALLTAVSPLFAASGRVRFRVIDPTGGPILKASVAVLNSEDKAVQCIETDQFGEAALTGLPLGDSRFAVASPGLIERRLTLTFHNGKEVKVEVYLRLPIIGTVVEVKPKPPRKHHGWLQY